MSFLSEASRQNTANQVNTWNLQAINSMEEAKRNFLLIQAQREAMQNNPDFDDSDRTEMDTILSNIVSIAKSLIPAE